MPSNAPLSPKRLEQLAAQLAPLDDGAVREAIRDYEPDQRLALKLAMTEVRRARGLTVQAEATAPRPHAFEQVGAYQLRKMGVAGPISLADLEARMTAMALSPEVRLMCKTEAQERRWLTGPVGVRVADEPPLSVQMEALYRRARLTSDGTYSAEELEALLDRAELSVSEKIAIKTECALRHQVHAAEAHDTWHERAQRLQAQLRRLRQLVRG